MVLDKDTKEDTISQVETIIESRIVESNQGELITVPYLPCPSSSIESMSREEILSTINYSVSLAEREGNLDYIFGSNGMVGKSATGNFSLLARGLEILFPPGLSRSHISNVLRGKVGPSHETLRNLSQLTGVSIDRISEYITERRNESKRNGARLEQSS